MVPVVFSHRGDCFENAGSQAVENNAVENPDEHQPTPVHQYQYPSDWHHPTDRAELAGKTMIGKPTRKPASVDEYAEVEQQSRKDNDRHKQHAERDLELGWDVLKRER